MTERVAKSIVAAEGEELAGKVELYEDYSGRGMYGRTTTAVTFTDHGCLLLAVAIAAREANDEEFREIIETLDHLRFDNLGTGYIAY